VWGSAFDDTIRGDQNTDNWLAGNDGNDTIDGRGGSDTADYSEAGAGVTVDVALTTAQNTGGAGTDTLAGIENLWGSDFGDTLTGDLNDNTITGGAGNDTMTGGDGYDAADYSDFPGPGPAGVTVDLSVTTAQNTGHGTDTLAGFEAVWGSEFNDTLIGDNGDNELDGWDGVDTTSYAGATAGVTVDLFNEYAEGGGGADGLYGFENATGSAFDDWIGGTDEDNVLAGGNGDDTVDYSMASAGVSVDLSVAVAQNTGGAGTDTLTDFESLSGSTFDDNLSGTAGDNWFMGWTGDDSIDGGLGSDTVDYTEAPAGVVVDLLAGSASGGDGTDDLDGIENVIGSSFDDTISGDAGDNELEGGDGVDMVSYQLSSAAVIVDLNSGVATGDGTDLLSGFESVKGTTKADTIYGDGGKNKLQGASGNDTVNGRGGADTIGGSDGNDTLRGSDGKDEIKGGQGDDFLSGGDGKDVCKGGPGDDTIKSCEN
jgi:Ca2+-binding RTX toxin-like protein